MTKTKASRQKNREANERLHAEKVRNHGLGRREVRRLLSSKRVPRTAADQAVLDRQVA